MRSWNTALAGLLVGLLLVGSIPAQVTLTLGDPDPAQIDAGTGTATIPITVDVDCQSIALRLGPSVTVDLSIKEQADGMTLDVPASITVAAGACAGPDPDTAQGTGSLTASLDASAPGLTDLAATIMATLEAGGLDEEQTDEDGFAIQATYNGILQATLAGGPKFLASTTDTATITLSNLGNAKTRVRASIESITGFDGAATAVFNIAPSELDLDAPGGSGFEKPLTVTFTAPATAYTEIGATLLLESSAFDDGTQTGQPVRVTLAFVSGTGGTPGTSGGSEDSPGMGTPVLALALVGLALVLRRRA